MNIKGLQKTTLLDYPGKVACTIFTSGCNFRCPFCHNASLVTKTDGTPSISEEEILSFLKKRQGILDGVCITGGEPLLQHDIIPFLEKIHSMGYLIKLDTNGTFPEKIKEIVDMRLVDFIAMDIKNSRCKYALTTGLAHTSENVFKSIELIMTCGIPYEFRTTVVRELHTKEDIIEMAEMIAGAEKYALQCFKDSGDLICPDHSAHSEDTMREMLELIKPFVKKAELRGM